MCTHTYFSLARIRRRDVTPAEAAVINQEANSWRPMQPPKAKVWGGAPPFTLRAAYLDHIMFCGIHVTVLLKVSSLRNVVGCRSTANKFVYLCRYTRIQMVSSVQWSSTEKVNCYMRWMEEWMFAEIDCYGVAILFKSILVNICLLKFHYVMPE